MNKQQRIEANKVTRKELRDLSLHLHAFMDARSGNVIEAILNGETKYPLVTVKFQSADDRWTSMALLEEFFDRTTLLNTYRDNLEQQIKILRRKLNRRKPIE